MYLYETQSIFERTFRSELFIVTPSQRKLLRYHGSGREIERGAIAEPKNVWVNFARGARKNMQMYAKGAKSQFIESCVTGSGGGSKWW